MKVSFITLGCKVNIYESNALMNLFEADGFTVCEPSPESDVFIINTCSVTNMADAKSRKMIHKARKYNKDAVVVAMGCYIQTSKEAREIPGVDVFIGNGNKMEALNLVKQVLENRKNKVSHVIDVMNMKEYEPLEVTTFDHTRAFVKIEDGCNNFCSYCIIPYARGPIRCKKSFDVIAELQRITNMGYEEVVLAGIHTGKYFDGEERLSDLIEKILKDVPKLKRLRLSSIEINEIDDKLLDIMKNNKIMANHLHLPLQTGNDKILKLMNRRYDTKFFYDKITKIREVRPDIAITTDVIVGFPYETDEDFNETKEFIKKVNFSGLHVFPYSKRSGTKAYDMPQVKDSIKKERTLDLIALSNELTLNYENKFLNKDVEVIFEEKYLDKYMVGHSSNYLRVIVPYDEKNLKQCKLVHIDEISNEGIFGHILS